jgi:hypothetical protein
VSGFAGFFGPPNVGTTGSPSTGTHAKNELWVDTNGVLWVCSVTGAPGTWINASTVGDVNSVTAGGTEIVVGGTASAPTIRTGTLDVIATNRPPVAAVAFNAQKGTGIANGSAATDIAAFGQIPVPGNGYGITGNTGATPTPAVGLSVLSGSLGSPVSISGSVETKVFDTASLGIGTWLVTMNMTANGANANSFEMRATVDTATATLTGATSAAMVETVTGYQAHLSISFIAVVTVAGTLQLTAVISSNGGTAEAVTTTESWANATGYTAVRIA